MLKYKITTFDTNVNVPYVLHVTRLTVIYSCRHSIS